MNRFLLLLLSLFALPAHAVVVSGTITRLSDGQPASGAQATLVQQVTPFQQVQVGQQTVGADGAYAFSFPNTGSFYLRASLASFLPAEQSFQYFSGSSPVVINLTLSSPSTITAVVRDAVTQAPVAGMPVAFYRAPSSSPVDAVTNAQGRATVTGVAGGDYRVCARRLDDAYIDECQDGQQLPLDWDLAGIAPRPIASGANEELPIALDIGASISGRITDRYFGGAASGEIRFTFYDAAGEQLTSTPRTLAADGGYVLAGLPAATYFLVAEGFGNNYYTRRVYPAVDCVSSCNVTVGTPIAVAAQQGVQNIDFALHPGAVVTGIVRDAGTLAPIAGATVRLYRQLVFPPGWTEAGRGQTALDGTFRIARYSYPQYKLAASASGYFARAYPAMNCFSEPCEAGDTYPIAIDQVVTGVDVALTPGGTIAGTIRGTATGGPVPGDVVVQRNDGSITFSTFIQNGAFETYGLPPGTYYAYAQRFVDGVRFCDLYQAQACAPTGNPIDPAVATPIVLGASVVQGVDFTLPNEALLINGFE